MTLLVASTAKASVVLAAALVTTRAIRSAAVRHAILAAALGSAALMPLLSMTLPHWTVPALLAPVSAIAESTWLDSLRPWVAPVWAAGALACAGVLATRLPRLASLAARCPVIDDGPLADLALAITAEYRLARPVTLLQGDAAAPLGTWGIEPKVVIPDQARWWTPDTHAVVLRHELAHVARRDWIVQTAAEAVRAIYWFNPLVWIACRRLRDAGEHACDAAVIRSGVDRREYAARLVDVARSLRHPQHAWPAAAMARTSTLERRVRAILDPRARAGRAAYAPGAAVVMTLAATLLLAAIGRPAQPEEICVPNPRAQTLTLLLDGRIVDLSRGLPPMPDPNAGLVAGRGFALSVPANR
ncbi:MAG TPA: M56 family metallopeptidase [Vicinamibacterales bacterium]|nr:M56 family metallopeptidase [Vicinamibacterales bacterium]